MTLTLLWLLIGWLPVWVACWILGRPRTRSGMALGAGLAAFITGMCWVELRRHGVLAPPLEPCSVPGLGIQVLDLVRFGACGLGGGLTAEILLRRWPVRGSAAGPQDRRGSDGSGPPVS